MRTDMRVSLAGPEGRAVGESGQLDNTGREKGTGFVWGVVCILAVTEPRPPCCR